MYYHCIVFFDVKNLVLCLTRELINYKIMQKLQCKTTFNSAFVGKKSSKSNKSRLWNNVFKKCGFYMKYIIKNYSDRILFARLCTIRSILYLTNN